VELKYVLERRGELKGLFNTSGQDYRALNLKETLPGLSEPQALALLSENGNLVKRPFALDVTNGIALVGFKEGEWQQALLG
jgi:arsenate reductase